MSKAIATSLAALLAMAGCTASEERTLTVFAAASLTDVFTTLEQRFEDEHPDVDVRVHFAGSSRLAQQLAEGASADVFASADEDVMRDVAGEGLLTGEPTPFATNTLTIAVEPGNPLGIRGLADLAREDVTAVVCQPQVPCGSAARELAAAHDVEPRFASEEPDVTAVLGKVRAGEADAGLVYVTDVRDEAVDEVAIDGAEDAVNTYPIATLTEAPLAAEFQRFVLGAGSGVLRDAGFGAP
ncbi:molybdate ABC transporter substrate-binding protein [Haloechinothrix salitolerans]|uniref:Molybdate ABC transporter substrate-binding protein n=1 Tax=Haloechinothrix salitolerans TaxID=926830 RepID=A0ABW2BTX4_9PSEU